MTHTWALYPFDQEKGTGAPHHQQAQGSVGGAGSSVQRSNVVVVGSVYTESSQDKTLSFNDWGLYFPDPSLLTFKIPYGNTLMNHYTHTHTHFFLNGLWRATETSCFLGSASMYYSRSEQGINEPNGSFLHYLFVFPLLHSLFCSFHLALV